MPELFGRVLLPKLNVERRRIKTMDDKDKQQASINVWGIANIGCEMENPTFQTLVVSPEAQKAQEADAEEVFVPRQLQFFDMVAFGSEEKQPKLIALLREVAQQIDTTSGRGWFCIYAGYRYYKQQLAVMGGYADFFADMEALVPDMLTKIDTTKEGEARYHNYTQLLGREASAWYMDSKKLPPLNEITVWKNRFSGDKNRYAANAKIIIDVYKRLKTI
jgi:hypothetical protein